MRQSVGSRRPGEASPERAPPTLVWGAVGLVLVALVVVSAIVLGGVESGPTPPFLLDSHQKPRRPRSSVSDGVLRLAGSGSNLPLTRALAATYAQQHHGRAPVIHPSIGSSGGLRALQDGAIDIALVSRPLKPSEAAQGLVAIPYARLPVMFAVHDTVADREATAADLVEIYAGRRSTWSDETRVVVLQRERGDSSHAAVSGRLAGFGGANEQAYQAGLWRVLYHDDAMLDALVSTPGGIGLVAAGRLPPSVPLHALVVDGVAPTAGSVADNSYPFFKDLAFVVQGEPRGDAAAFIEFAASPGGHALIREQGAVPRRGVGDGPG